MGVDLYEQRDFSAGVYSELDGAPPNAVNDLVNGLIGDDGLPFKRGGSAYEIAGVAPGLLRGVAAAHLLPGERVLVWDAASFYVVNGAAFTPALGAAPSLGGPVFAAGIAAWIVSTGSVVLYGGALTNVVYTTGTATVTNGSKTVTGVGTAWEAAHEFMFLNTAAGPEWALIEKVVSATEITLREPWPGASASAQSYSIRTAPSFSVRNIANTAGLAFAIGTVGSPARLVFGFGNRVYFSEPGQPWDMTDADQFHELPSSAQVVGFARSEDTLVVFTTAGVWTISDMALDAVDAFGNIQHTVSEVSKDVILWGASGLAGWGNQIVVPAIDDVYVFGPDSAPVSLFGDGKVRPLYRFYVQGGYQPGRVAVHRGHYLLPIMSGAVVVDVLVCRLDRGAAWSRWAGHAACEAYALRVGAAVRSPKLLGVSGSRLLNLSGCFVPSSANKTDADGSIPGLTLVTRDLATGDADSANTVLALEATAEHFDAAADNPTLAASYAVGPETAPYTPLTGAMPESDGTRPHVWPVRKKARRIRFRLLSAGATSLLKVRRLEMRVRSSGLRR